MANCETKRVGVFNVDEFFSSIEFHSSKDICNRCYKIFTPFSTSYEGLKHNCVGNKETRLERMCVICILDSFSCPSEGDGGEEGNEGGKETFDRDRLMKEMAVLQTYFQLTRVNHLFKVFPEPYKNGLEVQKDVIHSIGRKSR